MREKIDNRMSKILTVYKYTSLHNPPKITAIGTQPIAMTKLNTQEAPKFRINNKFDMENLSNVHVPTYFPLPPTLPAS